MKVKENISIAKNIYRLTLETVDNQQNKAYRPVPGQFLHVRISDSNQPLLRRPVSIHDCNPKKQETSLIYRLAGQGTSILAVKQAGDYLDVLGPLGNGFADPKQQAEDKIVLIGGGVGIPPLYYLAKRLVASGSRVTVLLGYQSSSEAFLIEEFTKLTETRIASVDGSIGLKGNVLQLINSGDSWDCFYAVGPKPMLKAIRDRWIDYPIEGYFSLEERMACGVGACYGCTVKLTKPDGGTASKKVCSDGPVFAFREVEL